MPNLCCSQHSAFYYSEDGAIIDERIFINIQEKANVLIQEGKTPALAELASQLERSETPLPVLAESEISQKDSEIYTNNRPGVLIVTTIYKCSHCPENHLRPASGFAISESGVGVTNYHIFKGDATDEKTDIAVVVMDTEGNVFPVTEVLAASFNDDIAIFRYDTGGKKVVALPLGTDPNPGEDVKIISHPHSMFYSFTKGSVVRSYVRNNSKKISVTAEFSQGSSGASVFDQRGNVVGVVSATLSLYNTDKNLQMVSREIIPVSKIRSLISN